MNACYDLAVTGPGGGWGHMGGGGWSGRTWVWGTAMVLTWVLVTGAAAWLIVGATARRGGGAAGPPPIGRDRARAILAERYVRGEISTEEYDERLAKLR